MIENIFLSTGSRMFGNGGPSSWDGHMMNMPFGGLFMILVLVALVYCIARFMKGASRDNRTDDTPLDILKGRYAKGEIDKDQFEKMKKDLADN